MQLDKLYLLVFDSSRYNLWLIGGARQNIGIICSAIEDPNIPPDRAHRVTLVTSIFRIDTVKKVNVRSFYSNLPLEFH